VVLVRFRLSRAWRSSGCHFSFGVESGFFSRLFLTLFSPLLVSPGKSESLNGGEAPALSARA